MKKVKPETVSFQPIIQVYGVVTRTPAHSQSTADSWAVGFDSGSNRDFTRASRTVFVKKQDIKELALKIEGFDKLADPVGGVPSIDGRILLVATYRDNAVDTYVLAECAFSPWPHHKGTAPVDDVTRAVRNGTTDAFTSILSDLFPVKSEGMPEASKAEGAALRPAVRDQRERGRLFGQRVQASRLQRWKPWLAVGSVVAVVWVLLSIFGKPLHSPEQSALAASGPNAAALQLPQATGVDAQAQVELVKSTLKSMGLDPGASGDTGCLVQPQ